jgi:hypothetical protein
MPTPDTSVVTKPIRAGLGLLTFGASRAMTLPQTLLARVPGEVVQRAVQAGGLAVQAGGLAAKGYGELAQRGEQTVTLVRTRLGMGDARPEADGDSAGATTDPYMGGPLEPVEDIREAVFLSEEDATEVAEAADGATLARDELPLEDYDHMTLTALRSRIRSLDAAQLVQLREYEQAHANRLPVVKAFDTRLAKLAKDSAVPPPAPPPPPAVLPE